MSMGIQRLSFGWLFLLSLLACEESSETAEVPETGWVGSTVVEGSVTTVRTTRGSVWGGDGRLVEEVAIGTEIRGENDILGQVYGIDTFDGQVFILDRIMPAVRVYDLHGNHLRDIGREGEGPGEFRGVTGIGIDPGRGQVVVRESGGTLHRFTLEGDFVERHPLHTNWSISGSGLLMRVTDPGHTVLYHTVWRRSSGSRIPEGVPVLFTIEPDGTRSDSMDHPISRSEPYILKAYTRSGGSYRPEEVPFGARKVWNITRDGSLLLGFSGEYSFEILHPDGAKTVIEREAEPIPVDAAERRAHERRVYEILRDVDPRWEWDGPEIPDLKAWYTQVIPDRSGRLWVLRDGEGRRVEGWTEPDDWRGWKEKPEWVSQRWFDVFDQATGRFLGRVDAPEGFMSEPEPAIQGNTFACLTEDRFGTPIVRVYRLELPDAGGPTAPRSPR